MSIIKTIYINEDFMRERIVIPTGVSEKNLLRAIRMTQAIYLYDFLGECLYDSLETHVVDGTILDQGNENWVTLLNLVKEWMVYRSAHITVDLIKESENLANDETSASGLTDTFEGAFGAVQGRIVDFIKRNDDTFGKIISECESADGFEDEAWGFPIFIPSDNWRSSDKCE